MSIRDFLTSSLKLMTAFALLLIKQPSSFVFYFLILMIYYFVLVRLLNALYRQIV